MAIYNGVGIGFVHDLHAHCMKDLVEIAPPDIAHNVNIWIVTHVDVHRTPNIQAFLGFLNQ